MADEKTGQTPMTASEAATNIDIEGKKAIAATTARDVVSSESDSAADAAHSEEKTDFDRYINLAAIVNFELTLQAGWEAVGLTLQYAFINGGPASLVYGAIFAGVFTMPVALSLGEMASIDPTVGAQYRWSARFAQKWPEFWGFMQGWITVFTWIANVGAGLAIMANMVSGLISFNNESYMPTGWHITLYMLAFVAGPLFCNFYSRKALNVVENISGFLHIAFLIAAIAVLAALSEKRSSAEFVFKTITTDVSGWENPGVAWSLGLLTVVYPITGADGVLHMAAEMKKPRKRAPWAMITSVAVNATLQFVFVLAILFYIGDYEKVAASGLPMVEIYYGATKSKVAATAMVIVFHGYILTLAMVNILASVSRLVWAFARDKGLPFHEVLSSVHPTLQVPIPALLLVSVFLALLSFINIGSSVAFTALVSLPMVAISISYTIPIFLLLMRKLSGNHPQYGPFRLGRWGIPINLVALCYLIYTIIWIPFPPMRPVTADNMNYAGPICLGLIVIALVDWFIWGRKRFKVPVGAVADVSDAEE